MNELTKLVNKHSKEELVKIHVDLLNHISDDDALARQMLEGVLDDWELNGNKFGAHNYINWIEFLVVKLKKAQEAAMELEEEVMRLQTMVNNTLS